MTIIGSFLENVWLLLTQLRFGDLVDLTLVWLVVYRVLLLTKRSGAVQILSGLGILAIAYLTSILFELYTFNWLLDKFFNNLFLIVVILFQGEIRRALAQLGASPFFSQLSHIEERHIVDEIVKTANDLCTAGYGALIVFEKEIALDYFVEKGQEIDAAVSHDLLNLIFHPTSSIHDGAVIIRGGRLASAGNFLPLSKNQIADRNLGTRHRAAIGLTEETDAFVVVVSEETRSIGIVQSGILTPKISPETLRARLFEVFDLKYKPETQTVTTT